MSELDVPPWQQPETAPATTEWFDESPFATGAGTVPLTESWFEGIGPAESPFAFTAGTFEEYEPPASGEDPPGLQRMLQLPGRFDDPKRDPAIDKDGTRFDLFLGGRSRRDFASSWLAQRPGLAEAAREPMADLTAGDIAKAWFVIHDVGVKSSLSDRRFKAADKATKKGSVHGFLNRSGYYAATHDFSKDRKGTVYEFLSRKGKKIAGGTTINIETVPDIENGVADRADGSHGPPSNANRYASIGYRKVGAKKVNYYKWTNAAFDILADLYILASARAGHLLTITAHKEMDRNLGRSVIWREYSAAEIRQAANKYLKKARDNPSDYHGDPFAFDVQALYDVITRKLNALGGTQMPPGARYGVHPLRLRTAGGADVGNGDGQLHEFPHQSDPRVKTDTKLKKPGWWAQGPKSEAEGFADESFDEALGAGEDEEDGFGEDPGAAFEDSHAFEGGETQTGLGGEATAEAERPEPEAATPWSEGAFGEYLDENGLTPGPISSYPESIGDFAREAGSGESEDESVAQARAFLGGSIWTYASHACGSRVSVFVPAAAQGREKVDLMLYVHGLLGPCGAPRVMPEGLVSAAPFALGRIVAESARPMILVVPRFQPGNDKSWSPHRLDRPGAINALFAEVLAETGRRLNRAAPAIDQLIVAGHSRAFGILYPLAHASASPELGKGALARLSRIWALDATYGRPPIAAFESLTKAKQGLGVEIVYRAKSDTDKFNSASRAGALALRPIPLSITHCAVPGRMLPALLAELPPPEALDAGSEAEDLWAETLGSGWSEPGVTETEWLEAEADALDRFDTLDSQTWDETHAFGESGAFGEALLESEDESPDRFDELGDGRDSEWESDEAEAETDREAEAESGLASSGLSPAERIAVEITSTLETGTRGGFYGLSGNFDGQGLSFGLVNWTIGTGSLQPLLREFAAEHPARWAAIFGRHAEGFLQLMSRKGKLAEKEQHRFAVEQMNKVSIVGKREKWEIKEPWAGYFLLLSEDPAFRGIQIRHVRILLKRAGEYCRQFRLKSEMAFAFMFDAVSSHGKSWLTKMIGGQRRRQILIVERLKALVAQYGVGRIPEREILLAIADVLGATSAPRWADKVRQRKRWFVTGEHPRARELEGLQPSPNKPWSAS
jgi:hypothetical protein